MSASSRSAPIPAQCWPCRACRWFSVSRPRRRWPASRPGRIGLVSLRLRDDYFAIVTLGFSEVVRIVITSERWLTNGVQGIPGIPRLYRSAGGIRGSIGRLGHGLRRHAPGGLDHPTDRGLAVRAPHRSDPRQRGGREGPRKGSGPVQDPGLVVGAALAGIAGAFYAHYITYIVPDQFIPLVTFYVWMAVIMGGVGRVSGAVVGAAHPDAFPRGSRFLRDIVPGVSEVEMASVRIGGGRRAFHVVHHVSPAGPHGGLHKR